MDLKSELLELRDRGEFRQLLDELDKSPSERESPEILLVEAEARLMLGQDSDAIAVLGRIPVNAVSSDTLKALWVRAHRSLDYGRQFGLADCNENGSVTVTWFAASEALCRGDGGAALECAKKLLTQYPADPYAQTYVELSGWLTEKDPELFSSLRREAEERGDSYLHSMLSCAAQGAGDRETATEEAEMAVALAPDDLANWERLLGCLCWTERFTDIIDRFQELSPELARSEALLRFRLVAESFIAPGPESLAKLRAFTRLYPLDTLVSGRLGSLLVKNRRYFQAFGLAVRQGIKYVPFMKRDDMLKKVDT